MKLIKNNILSIVLLACFIFFAIGSIDDDSTTSSSKSSKSNSSSSNVDLCRCLLDAQYGNRNESSCDNAINDYLGFNWKTTNFSKAPAWKNDKWDTLVNKCQ